MTKIASALSPIGPVPDDWAVKPLQAVVRPLGRKNVGLVETNLLSLSYGSIIRKDIEALEGLLPESFEGYQIVEEDDVVFRFTDLQNDQRSLRSGLAHERGIITSAYLAVRPTSINARYFAYLMRAYDQEKVFYSFGGGVRQSLKFDDVKRLPIPVPSVERQQRIAEFLDRETAQIDELIAKQEQLISTLAERFQSELDHLVLGHHSEDRQRLDYGRLQSIPTRWRRGRLKNVLSAPVVDGPHTTPEFVDAGYPFLSVDAIQDGELVIDSPRYVSEADFVEFRRKAAPRRGDLLMGKAASTGKIAQVKTDAQFAIWSPLALLRIDRRRANPSFVEYVLKSSPLQAAIDDYCTSNTQKNISMSDIPRLPMLLPPLPEQSEIVNRIEASRGQSSALHAKAAQVIEKLRERRQALISAAVTGQVDVGGAS